MYEAQAEVFLRDIERDKNNLPVFEAVPNVCSSLRAAPDPTSC